MKKQINKPYKMNWKMYGMITGFSIIAMILTVWLDKHYESIVSDVLKNLSFGFVASTLVAVFIERGNTKDKNEKAKEMYDAVYSKLKWDIAWYFETWASFCCVSFKEREYSEEKHTWTEWYELTRDNLVACDASRQVELLHFFKKRLLCDIECILSSIAEIDSQRYLLEMNEIYNEKMKELLADFRSDFAAVKSFLEQGCEVSEFITYLDSLETDLIQYIDNWKDVSDFNNKRYKPYEFFQ